ncbi:MAG TPA: hypothetical protein VJ044_11930, partial [Candidatus Hodarchaeales archaeon]|nr:hypothetical protein [Candidatus Hodarchaeales archaeon]
MSHMKPFSENDITRIKSLINLMDDEDDSIYTIARDHLISMGEIALPYLEVNLRSDDPVLQLRIRDAYEVITAAVLQEQLRVFRTKHKGDVDLEQGVLLISKYGYPQVDMRTFSDIMTFFSSELRSQIDITDAPEEIAGKIGKYFSEQKGFSGGEIDYYDSDF